jgi:hypothetical protein
MNLYFRNATRGLLTQSMHGYGVGCIWGSSIQPLVVSPHLNLKPDPSPSKLDSYGTEIQKGDVMGWMRGMTYVRARSFHRTTGRVVSAHACMYLDNARPSA